MAVVRVCVVVNFFLEVREGTILHGGGSELALSNRGAPPCMHHAPHRRLPVTSACCYYR